jgi:DNA-binding beta-propeller fold protein YncE
MKEKMCKVFVFLSIMAMLIPAWASDIPYPTYNYNHWKEVVHSPAAYVPKTVLDGNTLGVGPLTQPSDIFVTNEIIYVLDSGKNRLLLFTHTWDLLRQIDVLSASGVSEHLLNPSGLYVTDSGDIYIADSGNRRVVVIDAFGNILFELKDPKSDTFKEDFSFVPTRVAVDFAGRVYVVARGVYEGIMSFDAQGQFYGYQGTIKVEINPADILWRALSTRDQRDRQYLFIPTEFTSLDIDDKGFLYTTNVDLKSQETIKRLNPSGSDVLKRQDGRPVRGDLVFRPAGLPYGGPSQFVDIVYRGQGIYSALDKQRGRIFTYDHEGNLLYIFGTLGNQKGTFKKPVAIERLNDQLLVLDQDLGAVVVFETSNYGALINQAVEMRYKGHEQDAVPVWEEVLKWDANFELAYAGVGKALLASGENKKAMTYFERSMERKYYSIAYKRFRNDFLKEKLNLVLTVSVILFIFIGLLRFVQKWKSKQVNA